MQLICNRGGMQLPDGALFSGSLGLRIRASLFKTTHH